MVGGVLLIFALLLPSAAATRPAGGKDESGAAVGEPCKAAFPLEKRDSTLQANLERRLKAAGLNPAIDKKLLAVSVVDLTRANKPVYAGVNDNHMMYAASLPKIAVLLSVVDAVDQGQLTWTHEYDVRLQDMIVASDNGDASWATDVVGVPSIIHTMRDSRYCLYDNKYGGLWVGRPYRKGGATHRDPIANLSHGATARQAARFYTLLNAGLLVSPHWSFRMLGLMAPPAHFHKFVNGLQDRPGRTFLARKSGTWQHFHADSALIQSPVGRYVAVGLSEVRDGEEVMRKVIKILDDLIMEGAHRKGKKSGPGRRSARR